MICTRVRYLYFICGRRRVQCRSAAWCCVSTKETHKPPSALIQWPCAPLLFFLLGALTQRNAAAQKPSLTSVRAARFPFRPGARTRQENEPPAVALGDELLLRVPADTHATSRALCRNHVLQIKITLRLCSCCRSRLCN
jgi:hypothetical protein